MPADTILLVVWFLPTFGLRFHTGPWSKNVCKKNKNLTSLFIFKKKKKVEGEGDDPEIMGKLVPC